MGQEIKRTVNLKKSKVSINDRFDGWFGPSMIFVHSLCIFSLWIASDNEFKKMWCRKHVLTHTDSVLGLRLLVRNLNFSSACCCLRAISFVARGKENRRRLYIRTQAMLAVTRTT